MDRINSALVEELKEATRDELRDRLSAVIEALMSRGGDITLRGGNPHGTYKVELKYDN